MASAIGAPQADDSLAFPMACITRYCRLARPSIDTFPPFH